MKKSFHILFCLLLISQFVRAQEQTYAERLGFPKGSKVLIMHVDDAGMSWDSNKGVIDAMENGIANSVSIMMPCPWVPAIVRYAKEHSVDAGLHLTLTSEWKDYRWVPLSGKTVTPGLADEEGALWSSVEQVAKNASADEVEKEIRAQIDRAKSMGLNPTHLDSHMGTLFATPEFLQRYIKVGIETKIPVMFPGGHISSISTQMNLPSEVIKQFQSTRQMIWNAGLPVLDDLHNLSYNFPYPEKEMSEKEHQSFATKNYIETIKNLKPGLSMVIMHCTSPTEVFAHISDSGKIRKGDLLAMKDPALKAFIEKENIILTTWREVMDRREKVK